MAQKVMSVLDVSQPKTKSRTGYEKFSAIDPRNGAIWDLLISPDLLKRTAQQGMGRTKELLFTVKESLMNPMGGIYHGVRDREHELGDDDWLCYSSKPTMRYDYSTANHIQASRDRVFLIFVNDERVIYNFYWCKSDAGDRLLPEDYATRFLRRVL